MKRWLILYFAIFLTACASTAISTPGPTVELRKAGYPDLGAAPELVGDTWLNTKTSLRLANLRGKVVLLDVWTFG